MFKKIALTALIILTNLSYAAPQRFNFLFAEDGGTAQAAGYIVFENTLLPNPGGNFYNIPDPLILDLYVEVTGSSGGDGIFTIDDFRGVIFDTGPLALDFTRELVGQPTGNDPWGTPGSGMGPPKSNYISGKTNYDTNGFSNSGDFNLFNINQQPTKTSNNTSNVTLGENQPPNGFAPYILQAASGENMAIVSFLGVQTQSVPALNTLSVLLITLSLLIIGLFSFKALKP